MEVVLKENERIDDLQLDGLRIIQNSDGFCFGIDAVLLSDFARCKKGGTIVDLGTGTGVIPILLSSKTKASKIYGMEIQDEVADMARRSVALNDLGDRVFIVEDDLNNSFDHIGKGTVDTVVTNPPYFSNGDAIVNPTSYKAISRHEILCTLDDVVRVSSQLLKHGGAIYMVHRPHRLVDILCSMRKYRIEPKEIRFVHPKRDKKPNIVLIKGVKFGNPELKFMDPLVVYNDDGTYTDEIYKIYNSVNISVFDKRSEGDE